MKRKWKWNLKRNSVLSVPKSWKILAGQLPIFKKFLGDVHPEKISHQAVILLNWSASALGGPPPTAVGAIVPGRGRRGDRKPVGL